MSLCSHCSGSLNRASDSTADEFLSHINVQVNSNFYRNTPRSLVVAPVARAVPSRPSPALGSPFDTEDAFLQFKRMAALQGDFIEQAPRRLFVQTLAERQPVFSYRASRLS